jgi:hypothetical protein
MSAADRLSSLEGMLAGDHHRLDRAFQAIVTRAGRGDFDGLAAEWRVFQDRLLEHLDTEERTLIPALAEDRPVEAQVLLDEHAGIRVKLLRIGFEIDLRCVGAGRADEFASAMRGHAEREESIFYPWVDRARGA